MSRPLTSKIKHMISNTYGTALIRAHGTKILSTNSFPGREIITADEKALYVASFTCCPLPVGYSKHSISIHTSNETILYVILSITALDISEFERVYLVFSETSLNNEDVKHILDKLKQQYPNKIEIIFEETSAYAPLNSATFNPLQDHIIILRDDIIYNRDLPRKLLMNSILKKKVTAGHCLRLTKNKWSNSIRNFFAGPSDSGSIPVSLLGICWPVEIYNSFYRSVAKLTTKSSKCKNSEDLLIAMVLQTQNFYPFEIRSSVRKSHELLLKGHGQVWDALKK